MVWAVGWRTLETRPGAAKYARGPLVSVSGFGLGLPMLQSLPHSSYAGTAQATLQSMYSEGHSHGVMHVAVYRQYDR
jgi:hypothetical protein